MSTSKTYCLYLIKNVNNIHMYKYVSQISAQNIVEAEFLFESQMILGNEYSITVKR
jgi:hypothetical protein